MALCIAALCEKRTKCVVAANSLTTTGFPLTVRSQHTELKIGKLLKACVVTSCGDALIANEVITGSRHRISALPRKMEIASVGNIVRDVYLARRAEHAEQVPVRRRGLTLKEFTKIGDAKRRLKVCDQVRYPSKFPPDTEFLIAGVDRAGGHLGWIRCVDGESWLEWFDELGYQAIGADAPRALVRIAMTGQNPNLTVEETILHSFNALLDARKLDGAKHAVELAIVTKDRVNFASKEVTEKLSKIRQKVLRASSKALSKVEELLNQEITATSLRTWKTSKNV